jgi:hypothetical protein
MNRRAIAVAVCSVLALGGGVVAQRAPASRAGAGAQDFLLARSRAGKIEIGDTVDQIYERFGRQNVRLTDLFSEGMFTPALQVSIPGAARQPSLVVIVSEWPCMRWAASTVDVRDRRFRTEEDIGIGSTFKQILDSYPQAQKPTWGEGHAIVMVKALKLAFVLATEEIPPPATAAVVSVTVYGDPEEVRQEKCPQLGPIKQPVPD